MGEHEFTLKQSDGMLRAFVDGSPDSICIRDRDRKLLLWNAAFARGIKENCGVDVCLGMRAEDYIPEELLAQYSEQRKRLLLAFDGEPQFFELSYPSPDGSTLHFEVTWSPVREGDAVVAVAEVARNVTEQKADKTRARETETKYRSVVENANEAIIISQDGRAKFWNAQALALTGYSDDDIGTLEFSDFIHPDDLETVLEHYRKRIAGEEVSARYSIRLLTKSDSIRWVMVNSSQLEWEGLPASLVMLSDITDVVESRNRLLKAQETAHVGFLDWDLKTETILLSEEAKKIFGLGAETGRQPYEAMIKATHPDDLELLQDSLEAGRHGGKPLNLDHRIVRPDGTIRWVHAEADLREDAAGHPVSYIGTLVDITDRKLADLALQDAEEMYRTVADFTHDWEYWEGADGQMLYVSPACERITGYRPDEFIADPALVGRIILPEDRASWASFRAADAPEGVGRGLQFRIQRRDGKECWIEHVCRPVNNRHGSFHGFRASNRDVTERVEAQQELHKQRDALAHVNRTVGMDQLSGSIAHELNQPLTGILSNAQAGELMIGNNACTGGEMREIIRDIISDAKRAGDVIRNLRDLYRKQGWEMMSVDLARMVRDTLSMLHSEFVLQHVDLDVRIPDAAVMVQGNRVQLQQVLLNLLSNGVDAMKNIEETQHCMVVSVETLSDNATLSVEDCGIGIGEDRIHRIFEPLATWKPGGTGMGLAISNTIIGAHGGSMWAKDIPGRGARVGFTIALKGVDA
jgi:PAS domain S-box-containing protein